MDDFFEDSPQHVNWDKITAKQKRPIKEPKKKHLVPIETNIVSIKTKPKKNIKKPQKKSSLSSKKKEDMDLPTAHNKHLQSLQQKHNESKEINKKLKQLSAKRDRLKDMLKELNNKKDDHIFKKYIKETKQFIELSVTEVRENTKQNLDNTILEINKINKKLNQPYANNKEMDYLLNSTELLNQFINSSDISTLNTLRQEYNYKFKNDNLVVPINNNIDLCTNCNNLMYYTCGEFVCSHCGLTIQSCTIEDYNEIPYKEIVELDNRTPYRYDKITHLEDHLNRIEAVEQVQIPQEVLDKVLIEMEKERLSLSRLKEKKVKLYLKKHNLTDYYGNLTLIVNKLNGRKPLKFESETRQKITELFQKTREPYERHKPVGRSSFFSYHYILRQIFLIMGHPEYVNYLQLLKSKEKLRDQDEIFKKIVDELKQTDPQNNWEFFPTV